MKTVSENASDMILFGWPGTSGINTSLFGSVIDSIVANPPADVAIVRSRPYDKIRKIVVPVAGGPNSSLAMYTAVSLARNLPEPAQVVMVHVAVNGLSQLDVEARANNTFRRASSAVTYDQLTQEIVMAESPVAGILEAGKSADMIVIGATRETLFRNLLLGNVSQQVAEQASCPVILVKRRSTILESVLRETVLPPIHKSSKLEK